MICFADKTFCEDRECAKFNECKDALTEEVSKRAEKWWGDKGASVSVYKGRLDCFIGKKGELMISGIWENKYIQELGILDHCIEVIELKNEIRKLKPLKEEAWKRLENLEKLQNGLDKEMMDLYLILDKWAKTKHELKEQRLQKFKDKAKENK